MWSKESTSPCFGFAPRICNSRHPAINRGAPLPVAGIVATDGAEVRILQAQGDRSRPAGADRTPVHLDDRRHLDAGTAEERLIGLVHLGPVHASLDDVELE